MFKRISWIFLWLVASSALLAACSSETPASPEADLAPQGPALIMFYTDN